MRKLFLTISVALMALTAKAQCTQKIQIESILVDACNTSALEPNNEMVRFKNSPNPLNISQISIAGAPASGIFAANKWPTTSLAWVGLIQNATTASVTAALQASVVSSCGKLIEPPGGIIPANADVIMICSTAPSTTDNSFANLVDTIYLVYHNATYTVTTGHFANYSSTPGTRGLILFDNTHGCSDTASYDVSLLSGSGNGDAVEYDIPGNATYYNQGCQAAFVPISVTTSTLSGQCNNAPFNPTGVISGPAVTYTWTTTGTGTLTASTGTLTGNGTTTLTPTYTPNSGESGAITFTLTGQGKCLSALASSTISVFINPTPTPTISSSSGSGVICTGNSIVLTASSTGTITTTYTWSPSSPTATGTTFTVAPTNTATPTVYSVAAQNSCGTTNASFTVTVNPLPVITTINDSVCVTGTGTVSASGASTYTWSTGAHTPSISGSPSTYTVTGTDGNGCENTATAQVVAVALPTITTNTSSICEGTSVVLTASGGLSTSSYTWSPSGPSGNNSYSVTPASAGSIVVTGAGVHGCLNTHTVTVNATPTITVNSPSTCSGQAVTLQANPSTLSSYTWTGVSSSASSATVSPSSTTPYTVQATDANGCVSNQAVSTVSITAGSQISVVSTSTAPCIGSTYTLSANGATTYTWAPSSGTFTPLDGNNTQITVNQGAGSVTFTVSGTGACPATNTIVTINPAPVSTLTITASPANATVCMGDNVTLTTTGATTYTWNPSITDGAAFTPTMSATYSVNATDANGCAATASVAVTVNQLPSFTVNSPAICAGQTATLTATASGTYTYSWQGSSSTTTSATVIPVSTPQQTYTVQAVDGNNCMSVVQTSTVTTNSLPVLSVSSTTICAGSAGTLTATTTSTLSAVGSYTWSSGSSSTNIFTDSPVSTETISVTGTDGNGCVSMPASGVIMVNTPATLTVTTLPVCAGDNSIFTASGASTYTWSTLANTSSISVLSSNNQTYTVVGTDANSCIMMPAVATAIVNALPTITINSSSSAVCAGSTVTLTANGAGSSGVYTWDNGSNANPLTDNPTVATTYTVQGTDANNCSSFATTSITINSLPTAQTITGNTFVCVGPSAVVTALSAPLPGIWTGPAPSTATVSLNSTSANITQGGVYTLHTLNGCGDATTIYPVMADSVMANITANPLTGQMPLSVTFTNTSVGIAGSTLTYSWTFGDGGSSAASSPTEIYTAAGSYNVMLMATDGMCWGMASATIMVTDIPSAIVIPNVFTPNGDGINDQFFVTATGITNFECTIFDRWGLLLYTWDGLDGFWDGKAKNGAVCTDGTYYYLMTYTDSEGKQQKKENFILLVR